VIALIALGYPKKQGLTSQAFGLFRKTKKASEITSSEEFGNPMFRQ